MAGLKRITQPTLDVVEVLLQAHRESTEIHGWSIMKQTKRSGPTVYRVLDRLEDDGWVTAKWEDLASDTTRPRRRFYRLTGTGAPAARALLAERRPTAFKPKPALGFIQLGWMRSLLLGGGR